MPSAWCGIKSFCASYCPCRPKRSRRDKSLEAALEELQRETDVVALIRQQRLLVRAVKSLVPAAKVQEFEKLSKYTVIDTHAKREDKEPQSNQIKPRPRQVPMSDQTYLERDSLELTEPSFTKDR